MDILKLLKMPPRAEVQITHVVDIENRPKITQSSDAAQLFRDIWEFEQWNIGSYESMAVAVCDYANKVFNYYRLSQGGIAGTVADMSVLYGNALTIQKTFAQALEGMGAKIVVCHNHPSGNLKPSKSDIELTKRLIEVGHVLNMDVLDHVIITPDPKRYFSFRYQRMHMWSKG